MSLRQVTFSLIVGLLILTTGCRSDPAGQRSSAVLPAKSKDLPTVIAAPAATSAVATARDLVTALSGIGIACAQVSPQPIQPPEFDSATCDGAVHLDMFTFTDPMSLELWRQQVLGVLCASGIVGAALPVAIGASWAIGVEDETIASTIANGLGGSVVHAGDYCAAPG